MRTKVILVMALLFVPVLGHAQTAGEPFFVDLTQAANRDLEDDGIAANGKGGWTDEGINDMYVYPKLRFGVATWRGTPFKLIDPKQNRGRSVIMVRGKTWGAALPRAVTAAVPKVRGKYVYIMHHSTHRPKVLPGNLVANYILKYADGRTAKLPIRHGQEIQHWYIKQWWDNKGSNRYPVYMGRNSYSGKWRFWIGVWATRWVHPHPGKPIASITFEAADADVPVIFAVTISDADYTRLWNKPENGYKRPPGVPKGFFGRKMDQERRRVFAMMKTQGLVRGVRKVELIRPDILAVVVDSALGNTGVGMGAKAAAAQQKPGGFSVQCAGDRRYAQPKHPTRVSRQTYKVDTRRIGPFPANKIYWHTFYLYLPAPLQSGKTYTVSVAGLEKPFVGAVPFAYDPRTTQTPSIKVNQVAYAAAARRRYAYLGWWCGDGGTAAFDAFKTFEVVDEAAGKVALTGGITVRADADKLSGEKVGEMDLAPLTKQGRYHIRVPGLGRSCSFHLGSAGGRELYYHTMRAFMHQRCGCDLTKAVTDFPRKPCHVAVYENGHLVGGRYAHRPNEPIRKYYGGYHDAADFDVFTRHLNATARTLTAVELFPHAFRDKDLKLPESGDGAPDVLSEAAWGLKFFADNQYPDGAILHGRCNDCDSARQVPKSHQLPFGVFRPRHTSATDFAAVAAQYARLLKPHRPAAAAAMLKKAERAYAWGKAHRPADPKDKLERHWQARWAWAAAELFATTGRSEYNEDFRKLYNAKSIRGDWKLGNGIVVYTWPYVTAKQKGADAAIRAALRKDIIRRADSIVKSTEGSAYRMGNYRGGGWGNCVGGGHYGDVCLRAYALTKDQKYLDAASLNADFQLGCNPLSMSFITGMGSRYVQMPEISSFLKRGRGQTVKGISLYGPGGRPAGHPSDIPEWRRFEDNPTTAINCEFTVNQSLGPAGFLYATLWALQQEQR